MNVLLLNCKLAIIFPMVTIQTSK